MRTLTTAMIAMIACSGYAVANDTFLGVGIGWQQDKVQRTVSETSDAAHYQLRAGKVLEEQHRISASYSYKQDDFQWAGDKFDHTQHLALISYDYLQPLALQGKLAGYIGPTIGLASNKLDDRERTTFTWGAQAGLQYRLTSNWSVDLGYRYLDMDYNHRNNQLNHTHQATMMFDRRF
ncbi:porin family protein [Ferrimonas pelagia]|uniref:Outer membrane protein beta-barrel domain-containing protein n=1 Tax=Ferrimonas pelagia TaxID=1177826 RepID=A0ABP9FDT3_9GAMM